MGLETFLKSFSTSAVFFTGALITGISTPAIFLSIRMRGCFAGYRKWEAAAFFWAVLYLSWGFGWVNSGSIPVVVGSVLTCLANIFLTWGNYEFAALPMQRAISPAIAGAFLLSICYFYFVQPDLRIRTMVLCLYLIAMHIYAAWPYLRRAPAGMALGYRFAATVLAFDTVNALLHFSNAAVHVNRQTLVSERSAGVLFCVFHLVYTLGTIFAFFLLTNERLAAELRESNRTLLAEVKEWQGVERRLRLEVSERQRVEARLQHIAKSDELTGALNRRGAAEALQLEVRRAKRDESFLSVIVVDLDHFKQINDAYGHAGGDRALQAAVQACRRTLRTFDSIGRWGGEEFLIVLPGSDICAAKGVAERLCAAISSCEVTWGERRFGLSASAGVAEWREDDPDGSTAIAEADRALYRAKEEGRDCVRLALQSCATGAERLENCYRSSDCRKLTQLRAI